MNPVDAPNYPILTALNLHPLHRRQGTVVLRREVVDALEDLKLKPVLLPRHREMRITEVERFLVKSGLTAKLVKKAVEHSPWALRKDAALKRTNKPSAREIIAEAYVGELKSRLLRASHALNYFSRMDHKVARAALKCFGRPELAASWLTTPLKQLWDKAPMECRTEDVLQVLGRMENGVFG